MNVLSAVGDALALAFSMTWQIAWRVVEVNFGVLGLIPEERNAQVEMAQVSWDYTTWLNILFIALALVFVVRFFRTGGRRMLAMMGGGPSDLAPDHS